MFILCLFSFAILLYRQNKICPYLVSPLNIYVIFTFIYTYFSYVYILTGSEVVSIDLPNLKRAYADTLILYIFGINVFLYMSSYISTIKNLLTFYYQSSVKGNNLSKFLFFICTPFTLYFVMIAPWPEFGEKFTIYHSISAFFKLALLFFFCAEFKKDNHKLYNFLISLIILLVFFIDGARTLFFVFVISFFYTYKVRTVSIYKFILPLLIIFIIFLYITLTRNSISFSFDLMLWPFYSESIFGSYGVYNSIAVYNNFDYSYVMFPGYFIDLLSSIIFDTRPFMQEYINTYSYLFKDNKLYPYGGHFYLSDFIIYFHWFAIILFPLYFFIILWIYRKFRKFTILHIFLVCNFFFLVKTPIFVFLNTIIFVLLLYIVFASLIKIIPVRKSQ